MMIEVRIWKTEMGDEHENDLENTSGYGKSGVWLSSLHWEDIIFVLLHVQSRYVSAVLWMVNWLTHEILSTFSFSWWFPSCPLILTFSSSTLPSSNIRKFCNPFPSLHAMIKTLTPVQHILSIAYTAYCIIPRFIESRSHPVSHHLADHAVLKFQHSSNYELTNEKSINSNRSSLPDYCHQIDRIEALLQSCMITASKWLT